MIHRAALSSPLLAVIVISALALLPRFAAGGEGKAGFAAFRTTLAARTDLKVDKMPFDDFLKYLQQRYKISIYTHAESLRRARITSRTLVSANFKQLPLETELQLVFGRLKLRTVNTGGMIWLTNSPVRVDNDREMQAAIRRGQLIGQARVNQIVIHNARQLRLQQQSPFILKSEIDTIRSVCTLSDEKMKEIRKDAKEQLDEVVKELGQNEQANRWLPNSLQTALPDERHELQKKLATMLRVKTSGENADLYLAEVTRQVEHRRKVCARCLVALLDKELVLSKSQREKLERVLAANWKDDWSSNVEMSYAQGNMFLAAIPNQLIEPYLDESQVAQWQTIPKYGTINWGNAGRMFGNQFDPPDQE